MAIAQNYDPANTGVISRPEYLEGWNGEGGLLSTLADHIRQSGAFFLYGERFSGKTSLLKCLQYELKTKSDQWIPVYINFNSNISKSCESLDSYKFILASIFRELQNFTEEGSPWSETDINKIAQASNGTRLLDSQEIAITNALEKIQRLIKKYNKNLLLMFDDAEKMPRYFQGREDSFFYPIRELKNNWEPGIGGIACALASAEKISFFEHHTGSPQFNNVGYEIPVPPFDLDQFIILWQKLLERCSGEELDNLRKHVPDAAVAYLLCGGRPAFAKEIFNIWRKAAHYGDKNPIENKLRNIYERHPAEARQTLVALACDSLLESDVGIDRLRDFFLIEKRDAEIGGYQVRGDLLRDFLRDLANDPLDFANAGILAKHIITGSHLKKLLEQRREKGEIDDWLEFKACLVPTPEQMNEDRKKQLKEQKKNQNENQVKVKNKDDYIWHTMRCLIAMRNSRGGLLLLGVADNAEIVGMDNFAPGMGDVDFIQHIKLVLKRKKYKCSSIVREITASDWDMDDTNWIEFKINIINGRKVVSITIYPLQVSDPDSLVHIVEYEERKPDFKKEYALLRNKNAKCDPVTLKDPEFEKKLAEHRAFCAKKDDLAEFWQKFRG